MKHSDLKFKHMAFCRRTTVQWRCAHLCVMYRNTALLRMQAWPSVGTTSSSSSSVWAPLSLLQSSCMHIAPHSLLLLCG
uniref:Uncharacterized protein n=1 Tax=Anguilla anguilla TaxID=7936 RepID=A0A0E9SCM8_ANGAN